MKIEVVARVYYTSTLSDKEVEKVKEYIKDNYEDFMFMPYEEAMCQAIEQLYENGELNVYKESVESDVSTEEVCWSEYEENNVEEILGEELIDMLNERN